MPLDTEVGLGSGDIVLNGDPATPRKRGHTPNFDCGQTVRWIKMKLGVELGLGTSHIVLDGDPASPPQKGHNPRNFWPMSVVAKWHDGSRCQLVRK